MIPLRDNRKCSVTNVFCRKHCCMVLGCLVLRIKVNVNGFLVLQVSLTTCNICQCAISQNIAHLHHIDLYGNIVLTI